jgi:hypothetical protein
MKEIAATQPELPAAQLPIGAEKHVRFEDPHLLEIQVAPGDEQEVSRILLVLPGECGSACRPGQPLQADVAEMFLFVLHLAETGIADPKDVPEYA